MYKGHAITVEFLYRLKIAMSTKLYSNKRAARKSVCKSAIEDEGIAMLNLDNTKGNQTKK
jgi:hypothetical protein